MTIYSNYINNTYNIGPRGKKHFTLGVVFLTIIFLLGGLATADAADNNKQVQLTKKQKHYNSILFEMREVKKKYPRFAKRLGLVYQKGLRLPLLCTGGVDAQCHQTTQQSCINNSIGKPNYQYCLDLANRTCCRPAVSKQ